MELGAIISQKRKQAGLTIDELADRSGVPKGTLNKIINGYTRDPQIETVKSIARWKILTIHPACVPCQQMNMI